MDVAVQPRGRRLQPVQRLRGEAGLQRGLGRLPAEHAAAARARHGHAGLAAALGDENADQRVAGGRVGEFRVASLGGNRERHLGDDFAIVQGRLEQAGEEVARRDAPLVRDDRRPKRQAGGRIIGGRVVVGHRSADGAAVAHMRIADIAGERGERRNALLHRHAARDLRMGRHRADEQGAALALEALQFGDGAKVDHMGGRGQPLLHRRQQRVPSGKKLGVLLADEQAGGLTDGGGLMVAERIHAGCPPEWLSFGRRARAGKRKQVRSFRPAAGVTPRPFSSASSFAPRATQPGASRAW